MVAAHPSSHDAPGSGSSRLGFLAGGGRMGAAIGAFDWSRTVLGPIDRWPDSLTTSVSLILHSRFASALVWGPDRITIYNDRFEELLGGRHDSLGRSFADISAEAWSTLDPIVADAYAGRSTFIDDFPLTITRNGLTEAAYFTFCYSPIHGPGGEVLGMLDTVIETTRRVAVEHEMHRANADLEAEIRRRTSERDLAWNVSQDLQIVVDRLGTIRATNRAWTTVLGWSAEESIGQRIGRFVHGDDEGVEPPLPSSRPDEPTPLEIRMRHRDGGTRWMAWLSTSHGDATHASGRHVTAQKDAEERLAAAEDQLRQAQKMEAFGQLTGGIAHDFNNLLQAVSGSLEMLGRKHIHEEGGQRLIRLGAKALERAAHLTGQLLAFARKQSLEVRSVDTQVAMNTSVELARRSLPQDIRVETRIEPGTWPMVTDINQLDIAILNLVINARDAMPHGGTITVSTANVVAPGARVPADLAPGPYVRIALADTGTGMPEEVRARVFEPFFTTKGVGKGTGLGLSQVYGFAHQSGGGIAIESQAGRGTTVLVFLPMAARVDDNAVAEADDEVWRGCETVLVVDDDRAVRELAVACLQEYGYRVLEAASGVEGLEQIGSEPAIDLLLIDYAMPEMNGAETVRLARRIRPDLEVLFITGYADLRALQEHVEPGAILPKPFKLATLADRVAKGLARRAAASRTRRMTTMDAAAERLIDGVRDGATLAALRGATDAVHRRLHALPAFVRLVDGTIDLAGYRALLARLHGFHAPLETLFVARRADFARHGIDIDARRRVPALAADRAALGDHDLVTAPDHDATSTTAGLFGLLYVREGSTLGGRVIARHLDPLFGTRVDGRRFFSGDGRTAMQWRETCAALDRAAATEPDGIAGIVDGARRGFERFERWMT